MLVETGMIRSGKGRRRHGKIRASKKKLTKAEKLRKLRYLLSEDSARQKRVPVTLARFSWDKA